MKFVKVIDEWNDFINHKEKDDRKNTNNLVIEIEKELYSILNFHNNSN